MKTSYQEQIIEKIQAEAKDIGASSAYMFAAIKDCFAISRLEEEIDYLHEKVLFDDENRKQLSEAYKQRQDILTKYGIKAE